MPLPVLSAVNVVELMYTPFVSVTVAPLEDSLTVRQLCVIGRRF